MARVPAASQGSYSSLRPFRVSCESDTNTRLFPTCERKCTPKEAAQRNRLRSHMPTQHKQTNLQYFPIFLSLNKSICSNLERECSYFPFFFLSLNKSFFLNLTVYISEISMYFCIILSTQQEWNYSRRERGKTVLIDRTYSLPSKLQVFSTFHVSSLDIIYI